MKIFIIGANGRSGSLLAKEAVKRGHQVTGVVRKELKDTQGGKVLEFRKDLFDLTTEDLIQADVVIDAFGMFDPTKLEQHKTSLKHLTNILADTNVRLLVVGGAGTLFVDEAKTMRLVDQPNFPAEYYDLAFIEGEAYEEIIKVDNVKWSYFSPAAVFDAETQGTGNFVLGQDNLFVNDNGESYATYSDAAIAIINEVENNNFMNKRFTIVSN
ncbi:NAD(P)-dependent oxidoreductase [[Acholeplasma] multilocale]|uniref:NAD(P)-dependent oxidoreductase n=1 Tax=[Acholeplasma] multilocale TaxID=264638 RepID=UPI0004798F26|nr:NAD(P)H-binding protein [[Acholeplasma] multilocale]